MHRRAVQSSVREKEGGRRRGNLLRAQTKELGVCLRPLLQRFPHFRRGLQFHHLSSKSLDFYLYYFQFFLSTLFPTVRRLCFDSFWNCMWILIRVALLFSRYITQLCTVVSTGTVVMLRHWHELSVQVSHSTDIEFTFHSFLWLVSYFISTLLTRCRRAYRRASCHAPTRATSPRLGAGSQKENVRKQHEAQFGVVSFFFYHNHKTSPWPSKSAVRQNKIFIWL